MESEATSSAPPSPSPPSFRGSPSSSGEEPPVEIRAEELQVLHEVVSEALLSRDGGVAERVALHAMHERTKDQVGRDDRGDTPGQGYVEKADTVPVPETLAEAEAEEHNETKSSHDDQGRHPHRREENGSLPSSTNKNDVSADPLIPSPTRSTATTTTNGDADANLSSSSLSSAAAVETSTSASTPWRDGVDLPSHYDFPPPSPHPAWSVSTASAEDAAQVEELEAQLQRDSTSENPFDSPSNTLASASEVFDVPPEPIEPAIERPPEWTESQWSLPGVPRDVREILLASLRHVDVAARVLDEVRADTITVPGLLAAAEASSAATDAAAPSPQHQAASDHQVLIAALSQAAAVAGDVVAERVAETQWALGVRERQLVAAQRHVLELEDTFDRQSYEYRQYAKDLRTYLNAVADAQVAERVAAHALSVELSRESERAATLADTERLQENVSALEATFEARAADLADARYAHALAAGVFALESALDAGRSFQGTLSALQIAAGTDEVVAAVMPTLKDVAGGGAIATHAELLAHLDDMEDELRALVLVSGSTGPPGLMVRVLGRAAAALRAGETTAGMEGAIRNARRDLARGRLVEAAQGVATVARGSAAEAAVRPWVAAVHARAEVDQALKLLRGHAEAQTVARLVEGGVA